MSLEFDGIDELFKVIEDLGDVGNRISISSFKSALQDGLRIVQEIAPKAKDGSSNGAEALKVGKVRRYKSGSLWSGIGIDRDNWEETKHLYYQHHGYEFYKNGKRVEPHAGWMDEATKASEATVLGNLEKNILYELDKILK